MLPNRPETLSKKTIQLALRGDQQAFGKVYEFYLTPIYRYIFYKVKDAQEAEDLTETVFLKVWQYTQRQQSSIKIENFRAWIYRIAHNLTIEHYRKNKELYSLEDYAEKLVTNSILPEKALEGRQTLQNVIQALDQLEPLWQEIITLRFVIQLSHAETAAVLKLQPGHVRVLQYRALKKIAQLMQDE